MASIAEIPKFYVDRDPRERMVHLAKTIVGEVLLSVYGAKTEATVSQVVLDLEGKEGVQITQAMIGLIKEGEDVLTAKYFAKTFDPKTIDLTLKKEAGFKTNDIRIEMIRQLKEFNALSIQRKELFVKSLVEPLLSVKPSRSHY